MGCHAGRYSLPADLAAPEPKKGLTGDAHSQITRRVPAFVAGPPLPCAVHDGASGRFYGAIAQLGERLLCKQEVVGSIPSGSTNAVGLALCGKKLAVGWAGTIRACSSVG